MLDGKTGTFDVKFNDTVEMMKGMIEEREGIPSDSPRLIFAGKQFEDFKTLSSFGVKEQNTLHLVLRLKGC
ncbi:hypothetical protein PRIPAC_73467 [Pristionchus pacificus]|uniref:Ubq-2 n=1 Tax=Pristionchus pacificus TaxID=54126 RepID=A0A2A6C877_PRIPA|nr:hypothetical protein PRIPAC_73467 [Pristionchus pacificus]|eukprot:PDM74306.1 ubq-2 [Pristionchus pacificus]